MIKYSASKARANFNEVLALAKKDPVEIHKHGKPAVVILDAMKFEKLIDYIEDLEDNLTILEHQRNPGGPSDWTPLEEVLAELDQANASAAKNL